MTLEVGTPLNCKCPKCGGKELLIREQFLVSDVYEVKDGKLVSRDRGDDITSTGIMYGECKTPACNHVWRFRKSPIEETFA